MALYLDTETTGLSAAAGDRIVEVAIVNDVGKVLLNTLVNPDRSIPPRATEIHGITDAMVANAPSYDSVWRELHRIVSGEHLIIYNAAYDTTFFPDRLKCAIQVSCAMVTFAKTYAAGDSRHTRSTWKSLDVATRHIAYKWEGDPHRALADALACKAVWQWLRNRKS